MEENACVTVRLKPPQRAGHAEKHPAPWRDNIRQQLLLYSDSGTKFALLLKNCPIVAEMRAQGEFCTVRMMVRVCWVSFVSHVVSMPG